MILHMRKALTGIFFTLYTLSAFAKGGVVQKGETFLSPHQQRDSILIADHIYYGFELKGVEKGTILNPPIILDTLMDRIIVVSPFQLEKTAVRSQGAGYPDLEDYKGGLVITTFDEGTYHLPALTLQSISSLGVVDTLVFSPQILEVKTMPIDTATFKPHDLKRPIIGYPKTFKEVAPLIFGSIIIAIIIALIIWLIIRYSRRKVEKVIKRDPPHIVALRDLEKYRGNELWTAEKQKVFYSGITDILRVYISDRYGISAMEMTTSEIFREIKEYDIPNELLEELKDLFERADYVKFAKFIASDQDNAAALPLAIRYVTTTYQAQIEKDNSSSESVEKVTVEVPVEEASVEEASVEPVVKEEE